MRIVRGDHLIDALVWARDASTLWHALKRLMIPWSGLLMQSEKIAIGSFLAVLFLLFIPFPIFAITNVYSNRINIY